MSMQIEKMSALGPSLWHASWLQLKSYVIKHRNLLYIQSTFSQCALSNFRVVRRNFTWLDFYHSSNPQKMRTPLKKFSFASWIIITSVLKHDIKNNLQAWRAWIDGLLGVNGRLRNGTCCLHLLSRCLK